MGSITPSQDLDVLVVGAGFGGISITHKLREHGFNVQCFEKGAAAGGIWYWNCYPGARVDSHYPVYQLTDKELWQDFTWTEKFPGQEELRRYFACVTEKWSLKQSVQFNKNMTSANFDDSENKWTVTCEDGTVTRCRFLIAALGFAAKPYIPPFKNIDKFKGPCFHTAKWPQEGIDLNGKRVACLGTGATGVQVIQEIAPIVKQMTVFQRTPNTPVPMRQEKLTKEMQDKQKADGTYETMLHKLKYETRGGFNLTAIPRNFADDTPEQRREVFEGLWKLGGFNLTGSNYQDMFTNREASEAMHRFWAEKQGPRIRDPRKRAIVVPPEPKFTWAAKTIPMEQSYFEAYNYDYVDVIALDHSPILEFTEKGIRTEKEDELKFDVVILATGFDAITGGMTQIDVRGTDGLTFRERWARDGIYTNMGLACPDYPNLFFFYGPQGPTAFSNGPTCVEIQAEWVDRLLCDMREKGQVRVEAEKEASEKWKKMTNELWDELLFSKWNANNWYSGANIPGKRVEALNWLGGNLLYRELLGKCRETDYEGFSLRYHIEVDLVV